MGSFDRSKKRFHQWKKAALHFALCFIMGFFSGFAPTTTPSSQAAAPIKNPGITAAPIQSPRKTVDLGSHNTTLLSDHRIKPYNTTNTQADPPSTEGKHPEITPPKQLIIITTTSRGSGDRLQEAFLRRLANTLRLVPPPLLWILVEAHSDAPRTDELMRKTGVMYRHLTFKEDFADAEAEADHQRNVALNHIEYHRIDGIVHFAGVSNTYDLQFFEAIRDIEVFGTWPVAVVSSDQKQVVVEGPICSSSKVVGWQWKDFSNVTTNYGTPATNTDMNNGNANVMPSKINISGFAFNSSILWDPERWGRPSSVPDTSQDSIKFIQQVVLEDETKLMAIPPDCSWIMTWHLHL